MNHKLLEERMNEVRKWAADSSENWHKLVAEKLAKGREYLLEQKNMLKAMPNAQTESWTREQIEQFNATSPHFRGYPGMPRNYERSSFSTR